MKDADIIPLASKIGKSESDIANLQANFQKSEDEQNDRIVALENRNKIWDIAIAKWTAIWGFILFIAGILGGFISYNFIKVKLAVVAAFHAFNGNPP